MSHESGASSNHGVIPLKEAVPETKSGGYWIARFSRAMTRKLKTRRALKELARKARAAGPPDRNGRCNRERLWFSGRSRRLPPRVCDLKVDGNATKRRGEEICCGFRDVASSLRSPS